MTEAAKPVNLTSETITSVCIEGAQYDADEKGVFEVKAEHADQARALGLVDVKPAKK